MFMNLSKGLFASLLYWVLLLISFYESCSISVDVYTSRIEHPGPSTTLCWVIIPDDGYDYEKRAKSYQEDDYNTDWYKTTVALYQGCSNPDSEFDEWLSILKGFKTPSCTSEGFVNATGIVHHHCDLESAGAYSMIAITSSFDPSTMEVELDYYYDGFFGATIQDAYTLIPETNMSSAITSMSFEVDSLWDASCEGGIINFDLPIVTSTDGLSQTLTLNPNLEYSKTDTARTISCAWIITPMVEGGRLSDGDEDDFDSVWLTIDWPPQMFDEDYIVIYDASSLNGTHPPARSSCIHDSRYAHSFEDACYAQTNFPLKSTDGSFVVMFTSQRTQDQLGESEGLEFDFSLSFQSSYCIDPDCNGHGTCTYGVCECEEGWLGTSCDLNIPVDWTCDPSHYNTLDGCDCSCQAYDPDCDVESTEIRSCNTTTLAEVTGSDLILYGAIEAESGFCLYCPLPDNFYTSEDYPVVEYEDGEQITDICPTDLDCDFCDEQTGFCIDSASADASDIAIKYCDSDLDCPLGMNCMSDGTCSDTDEDDDYTTGSVSPITVNGTTCKLPFTQTDWLVNEGSCVCDGVYDFDYGEAFHQAESALDLLLENNNLVADTCAYMSPYKAVITTTSEVVADCQLLRFTFSGFGDQSDELGEAYFQVFDVISGDAQLDAVSKEPVKGEGSNGEVFSYCLGTGLYQLLLEDSGGNGWLNGTGTLTVEGDGFTLASGTVLGSFASANFSVCNDVLLEVTFSEETGAGSNFTFVDESNTVVTDLLGVQMSGMLPGTCTDTVSYSYCLAEGSAPILTTPVKYHAEEFRFQYWNYAITQKAFGRSVLKYSGILGADWNQIFSNGSEETATEFLDCNNSLALNLYDSYGDGWNGYYFSLYNKTSGGVVQTVTLESGTYEETCLNVEENACYTFSPSESGLWGSELSWMLCDQSGTYDSELSFCVDGNGTCVFPTCNSSVYVYQYDSYGDGWGGYQFALSSEDGSTLQTVMLVDGSEGQVCLDVENDNCYYFGVLRTGQFGSEISYELCGVTGGYDDLLQVCILEDGSCVVKQDVCLDIEMYDTWGDGWNGNYFSLYAEEDPYTAVSTVTLDSGSYQADCVTGKTGTCYTFSISSYGSYQSEVYWYLCGIWGDVWNPVSICIDFSGTCSEDPSSSSSSSSGRRQLLKDEPAEAGRNSGTAQGKDARPELEEELQQRQLSHSSSYYSSSYYSSYYGTSSESSDLDFSGLDYSLITETTWCEQSGCADSLTLNGLQNFTHVFLTVAVKGDIDSSWYEYVDITIGGNSLATCSAVSQCGYYSEECFANIQVGQYVDSQGDLTIDYDASADVGNFCYDYTYYTYYAIWLDVTITGIQYTAQCQEDNEALYMYDSSGDGWQGYTLSLYSTDDSNTILQNVTMDAGFINSTCLDVQVASCYFLAPSSYGSFPSEVSWSICGETGTFDSDLLFCIDEDGICSANCPAGSTQLDQYSFLDGWSGYYFSLYMYNEDYTLTTHVKTVTLQGHSVFRTCVDLQSEACYVFEVSAHGLSDYGIFWEVNGVVGTADTVVEFCTTNDTVTTDSGCANGFKRFGDACSKMYTTAAEWYTARDTCIDEGGDLLTVETLTKQLFGELYWFPNADATWIGLTDQDLDERRQLLIDEFPELGMGSGSVQGKDAQTELEEEFQQRQLSYYSWYSYYDTSSGSSGFQWVDGSDLTYTNWDDWEPDYGGGACVEAASDGLWSDEDCDETRPYVCEVPVSYCNGSVYLNQFDAYGDGWNGYYFTITDDTSTAVQEITLDHGSYGYTCLEIPTDACYTFAVSTVGTWESEISWELCGLSGNAGVEVAFCLDRNGACSDASSSTDTEETTSESEVGSFSTEICSLGYDECSSNFPNVYVDMCDYSGSGWHMASYALLNSSASELWFEPLKSTATGEWDEEQLCLDDLETDACYGFAVYASDLPEYQAWSIPSCGIYGKKACDIAWFCIDDDGSCTEWSNRDCKDPALGEVEVDVLSGCDPVSSSYYQLYDVGLFGYTNSFTVRVQDSAECENILLTVHLDFTNYGSNQEQAYFEIINLDTGDNHDTWSQVMAMESGELSYNEFSKVFVYCISAGSYQLYMGDQFGNGWERGYVHVSYSTPTQNREVGSFTVEPEDGREKKVFFDVGSDGFFVHVSLQWPEDDGYPTESSFEILTLMGDDEDLTGAVMSGSATYGTVTYSFLVDGTEPLYLHLKDTLGDGWNGGTYNVTYSFNDVDQAFFLSSGTLEEGYSSTVPLYLDSLYASVMKDVTFERKDESTAWNRTVLSLPGEWHGCACASCDQVDGLLEAEATAWEALNISYSFQEGTQYCNEVTDNSVTMSYIDPDHSEKFILTYEKDENGDWSFSNGTSGTHGSSCYESSTYTDCKRSKQGLWCFVDEEQQQTDFCSSNSFDNCADPYQHAYRALEGVVSGGALTKQDMACSLIIDPNIPGPLSERAYIDAHLDIMLVDGSDLTMMVYSGINAGADILYSTVINDYVVPTEGENVVVTGPEPTLVSELSLLATGPELRVNSLLTPGSATQDVMYGGYASFVGSYHTVFDVLPRDMNLTSTSCAYTYCLNEMADDGFIVFDTSNSTLEFKELLEFTYLIQLDPLPNSIWLNFMTFNLAEEEVLSIYDGSSAESDVIVELTHDWFSPSTGSSAFFNSSSGYALVEAEVLPKTLLMWIKAADESILIADSIFSLTLSYTKISDQLVPKVSFGTNETVFYGDVNITTSTWSHLAVNFYFSQGFVEFLVNGTKVQTCKGEPSPTICNAVTSEIPLNSQTTDGYLVIGGEYRPLTSSDQENYDPGLHIDELMLFDDMLDTAEIHGVYHNGSLLCDYADPRLTGCYHMDTELNGFSAEVIEDSSMYGNHAFGYGLASKDGFVGSSNMTSTTFASSGSSVLLVFQRKVPAGNNSNFIVTYQSQSCDCANGECERGICICDAGFGGESCDEWIVSDACTNGATAVHGGEYQSVYGNLNLTILNAEYKRWTKPLYPAVEQPVQLPQLSCDWLISEDYALAGVDWSLLAQCYRGEVSFTVYDGIQHAGEDPDTTLVSLGNLDDADTTSVEGSSGELEVHLSIEGSVWNCSNQIGYNGVQLEYKLPKVYYVAPNDDFLSTINVRNGNDDAPFRNIVEALAIASANDIILLYPGRYSGPDNVNLIIDKSVTIRGISGAQYTILDAEDRTHHFTVSSYVEVNLEGLTLRNGYSKTSGSSLMLTFGSITVTDCVFLNNVADVSATVHVEAPGVLNMVDTTFKANFADFASAVLSISAKVTANGCNFNSNEAALYGTFVSVKDSTNSIITLSSSIFKGNKAKMETSILVEDGNHLMVSNCTFANNVAEDSIAGIHATNGARVDISKTEFLNNEGAVIKMDGQSSLVAKDIIVQRNSLLDSEYGVFLFSEAEIISISNGHFDENEGSSIYAVQTSNITILSTIFSRHESSAMYLEESFVEVYDSFFQNNSATDGAAIYMKSCAPGVSVKESTFVANHASEKGGALYSCESSLHIEDSTFFQNHAYYGGSIAMDDTSYLPQVLKRNSFDGDTALERGGSIFTFTSRNVKAYDNVFTGCSAPHGGGGWFLDESNIEADQITMTRCTSDSQGGGLSAIAESVLYFYNPVFSHCEAESGGALAIGSESFIQIEGGSFEHNYAIDGGALSIEEQSDVKIYGGVQFAHNSAQRDGGAIFLVRLKPTEPFLMESTFSNNTAGTLGGGLYMALCESMEMANIFVSLSSAEGGGAIAALASQLVINDSQLVDSFTLQGGIYLLHSNTLIFDTIMGNSLAVDNGGLVYGFASDIFVFNSYFVNGTAGDDGGGLFLFDCPFHVYYSTFTGNKVPQGKGGGLFLTASDKLDIMGCLFSNNFAEAGGAGLVQESTEIVVWESVFKGNRALYEGAGMMFDDSSKLTVSNSTFESNKVVGTSNSDSYGGGAIKINLLSDADVKDCRFVDNGGVIEGNSTIFLDGGALYISYSFCSISSCYFAANIANDGGALYVGADPSTDSRRLQRISNRGRNSKVAQMQFKKLRTLNVASKAEFSHRRASSSGYVQLSQSTFMSNYATSGGGAFSFEDSEPGGIEENSFVNNSALYGGDFTSPPTELAAIYEKQLEGSGYQISTITVELLDDYGQVVRGQNAGTVFCTSSAVDATVSGQTSATFVQGVATFSGLVVERLPNTSVNISFSSAIVEGEVSVEISFKPCVIGEVLPENSGKCIRCEYGFFSVDPTDTYCHDCPVGAACFGGSNIRALQEYWRFPNSTGVCLRNVHDDCTLTPCLESGACLGDIMISESVRFDPQDSRKLIVPSNSLVKLYLDTYCWESDGNYAYCKLMLNGYSISLSYDENAVVEDDLITKLTLNDESYEKVTMLNLHIDPDKSYTVHLKQDEGCNAAYVGNLCAGCAEGYGSGSGYSCTPCPPTLFLSYIVFCLGLVAVIVIGGMMIKLQMDKSNQSNEKLSIMMKIFTSYMQLVSLFSGFDFSWPEAVIEMFDSQEVISKAGDRIISVDCVISNLSGQIAGSDSSDTSVFYKKLAFFMLAPVIAVIFSAIFWYVKYLKKAWTMRKPWDYEAVGLTGIIEDGMIEAHEVKSTLERLGEEHDFLRVHTVIEQLDLDVCPARVSRFQEAYLKAYAWILKENWILSVVVLLFLLHPNVSSYTFHVFTCQQLETGKFYLSQDLDTECGTPEHTLWKYGCGIPCILAYTFGIPVYAFFVLHHYRNDLNNDHVKLKYGFLYTGYEQPYYFWELWVMLRKVTIISVLVFIGPFGSTVEAIAGLAVTVVALVLHLRYQPYEDDSLDVLETYSLYTTVTTLFCGLFFFSGQIGTGAFYFTLQIVIIATNVGFVSFFFACSFKEYKRKLINDMKGFYDKLFTKKIKYAEKKEEHQQKAKKLLELQELYEEKVLEQDALTRIKAELQAAYKLIETKKEELTQQEYRLDKVSKFFISEMKEPIVKELAACEVDDTAFLKKEIEQEIARINSLNTRSPKSQVSHEEKEEHLQKNHSILGLYKNIHKTAKQPKLDTDNLEEKSQPIPTSSVPIRRPSSVPKQQPRAFGYTDV